MLLLGRSVFPGTTYEKILVENRACDFKLEGREYDKLDPQAMDLMVSMLKVDPKQRINSTAALQHPYLVQRTASILRQISLKSLNC